MTSKMTAKREATEWFQAYKRNLRCEHCGYQKHIVALDFHHPDPTAKEFSVSQMVVKGQSLDAILEEIAKCVVLCANCHREEHARISRWRRPGRKRERAPAPAGAVRIIGRKWRGEPKLCLHKASGKAYVTDPTTRREVYFGPWGSEEAGRNYERWREGRAVAAPVRGRRARGLDSVVGQTELALLLRLEAAARATLRNPSKMAALGKAMGRLREFREAARGPESVKETASDEGNRHGEPSAEAVLPQGAEAVLCDAPRPGALPACGTAQENEGAPAGS